LVSDTSLIKSFKDEEIMNTKKILIKSLMVGVLALVACDPEYPTPYVTNEYNSNTNYAGFMFVNLAQNTTALTMAVDNGEPLIASEVDYTERYPLTSGYNSNTIRAGARNIRIFQAGTSLVSTRSNLNAGANSSFYVIGRADVTNAQRSDRARLFESLGESLPAIPTSTPNTVHVRLMNFGLTTAPIPPSTSGGTLGSIALRIDATSVNAAPTIPATLPSFTTNGTYFLPDAQVFPIAAPAASTDPDWRTLAKSYANATSPFTALTVPAVGGAGNDYIVDVVTSSNGNVVIDNVALNLVAGRVYTLALIGSSVGSEQPYQLLVIRHR
jgi:hypothetical protein